MSDAPWRDPGLSLDERLCHVLEHTVIVDAVFKGVPGSVAILRETFRAIRADALEEAARREDDLGCFVVAARIRALKAYAPTA